MEKTLAALQLTAATVQAIAVKFADVAECHPLVALAFMTHGSALRAAPSSTLQATRLAAVDTLLHMSLTCDVCRADVVVLLQHLSLSSLILLLAIFGIVVPAVLHLLVLLVRLSQLVMLRYIVADTTRLQSSVMGT